MFFNTSIAPPVGSANPVPERVPDPAKTFWLWETIDFKLPKAVPLEGVEVIVTPGDGMVSEALAALVEVQPE
jgi:predicted transposase YdaD